MTMHDVNNAHSKFELLSPIYPHMRGTSMVRTVNSAQGGVGFLEL